MESRKKTEQLAEEMAELTCELARTCSDKENYFASLFNLTPAEFKCLRLFSKTNSLTIKTISVLMNLTPGRITHILTSLEKKKFIKRKTDTYDKRNVIVTLTGNSEPFLKNLNHSHIKLHEEILQNIEQGKHEEILDAIKQLINALRTWSAKLD
ncbi:MAG: MarR family transcriptional regulator [Melioribacteraceae bacterium]|nr:MarR family transcriptional regulator [Melioribacteraceae bacterium]